MQRRDPTSFLEGVLAQVPELSPRAQAELLALVNDKAGPKRAVRIVAILSAAAADSGHMKASKDASND